MKSCLIVGAGMSGLTAAIALQKNGWNVTLADKGRGVGGRMATRRIGGTSFDHGAQFFTARDNRFQHAIEQWERDNVVKPWFTEGGHPRYRAVSGMNGLAKHLAKTLDVRSDTPIKTVEPGTHGWIAVTAAGERIHADALLLTAPAPQSAALLAGRAAELAPSILAALQSIEFEPCFALLVSLAGPSLIPASGYVRIEDGPVEWIADNTRKGISDANAHSGAALTVHARADFSRRYLESPQDEVAKILLEASMPWFGEKVGVNTSVDKERWQLHRWRYSKPVADRDRPSCLFTNHPSPLAVAGDAFGASRVESAFLSGLAAAEKISDASI